MDFSYGNAERRCEREEARFTYVHYDESEWPILAAAKNELRHRKVEFKNLEPYGDSVAGKYCVKIEGSYDQDEVLELSQTYDAFQLELNLKTTKKAREEVYKRLRGAEEAA